ncbi:MAG: alpha/beta hydrolase, partial [Pseudomonadota bacterium]
PCGRLAEGAKEEHAMPDTFTTPQNRQLAYHRHRGESALPGIVFLGGFRSDMTGTKALHLEAFAQAEGRDFLRFDYSGHGASSGDFLEGCIGDWAEDAEAALTSLTEGPQILVGSSMGGWIALLLARKRPERLAGLVGIAAAPDFTEDSMWAGFDEAQRNALLSEGQVALPSDYSDDPYIITRRLSQDEPIAPVFESTCRFPCRSAFSTARATRMSLYPSPSAFWSTPMRPICG